MALDPQFLDAIKGFEGYSPNAAWDYKQSSSGYGTKAQPGDENIPPDQLKAVHEQRYQEEIAKAAAHVDSVNPNLPAGARAALVSLTYNAGPGWAQSGLGEMVRSGDLQGAASRFLEYNKAGGEVNPGLVARRQKEAAWFGGGQPQSAPATPAGPAMAPPAPIFAQATPLPASRPDAAPIFSTQEGNTERINDSVSMAHPARIQRMEEMLRSGLIPRSTYDDYMKMIGRSAPQKPPPGAPLSLAPPAAPIFAPQPQAAPQQMAGGSEPPIFGQMQAPPIFTPPRKQIDLSKLRAAFKPPSFYRGNT